MSRFSGFLTERERGHEVVSLIILQEKSVHQSLEEVELESVIQTNLSHTRHYSLHNSAAECNLDPRLQK